MVGFESYQVHPLKGIDLVICDGLEVCVTAAEQFLTSIKIGYSLVFGEAKALKSVDAFHINALFNQRLDLMFMNQQSVRNGASLLLLRLIYWSQPRWTREQEITRWPQPKIVPGSEEQGKSYPEIQHPPLQMGDAKIDTFEKQCRPFLARNFSSFHLLNENRRTLVGLANSKILGTTAPLCTLHCLKLICQHQRVEVKWLSLLTPT